MPSLSASVPAAKLKVMRPGKPVARPMPGRVDAGGGGGVVPGASGSAGVDPVSGAGIATKKLMPGAPTMARGPMQPKPATGGGFQFRPRDMVGGPAMMPGGGSDIQTAIKSLRGQLGMPAPAAPGGPSLEPWQQGGGSPDAPASAVAPTAPAAPAWKQLADLGVGGQGSAAGNRAKLAELLAARSGGTVGAPNGPTGIEPGNPSMGVPANPAVNAPNPFIRRMPATVSGPSSVDGGSGGAVLQGNQGPMGPGQPNAYLDILNRRGFGGFGGLGGRGLNLMAAGAGQYAG